MPTNAELRSRYALSMACGMLLGGCAAFRVCDLGERWTYVGVSNYLGILLVAFFGVWGLGARFLPWSVPKERAPAGPPDSPEAAAARRPLSVNREPRILG